MNLSFQDEQDNLRRELAERIKESIEFRITEQNGILKLLRNRKLGFENNIEWGFNEKLEHGQMGIKSQMVETKPYNFFKNVAVIRMDFDLDKIVHLNLRDFLNSSDFYRFTRRYILNFCNQLERFVLRGMDIIHSFTLNELKDNESFNSFFTGDDGVAQISDLKGDLFGAVLEVSGGFRDMSKPPCILMSDGETHNKALRTFYGDGRNLIYHIKENQNIEWIDIFNNANSPDDYKLVCFKEEYRNLLDSPFYLIERKDNPVNVYCFNTRVIVSWAGALEIRRLEGIKRLKLNYSSGL